MQGTRVGERRSSRSEAARRKRYAAGGATERVTVTVHLEDLGVMGVANGRGARYDIGEHSFTCNPEIAFSIAAVDLLFSCLGAAFPPTDHHGSTRLHEIRVATSSIIGPRPPVRYSGSKSAR